MCRFLDAGNKEAPHTQLTGVQKAPRHEVAGGQAEVISGLRGFVSWFDPKLGDEILV